MGRALVPLLVLVAGCDQLFGLQHLKAAGDGGGDTGDDSGLDAGRKDGLQQGRYVQGSQYVGLGPSAQIVIPMPQVAGDLNVLIIGWSGTAVVETLGDLQSNNYLIAVPRTSSGSLNQVVYYAANITGGTNTLTITFSEPTTDMNVRFLEYSGLATSAALQSGNVNTGTDSMMQGGNVNAGAGSLIVAGFLGTFAIMPSSPLTPRLGQGKGVAADLDVTSDVMFVAKATQAQSGNFVVQTIVLSEE